MDLMKERFSATEIARRRIPDPPRSSIPRWDCRQAHRPGFGRTAPDSRFCCFRFAGRTHARSK